MIFGTFLIQLNYLIYLKNKANNPNNSHLKHSDQVIISRIRIGHSKLTHTLLTLD